MKLKIPNSVFIAIILALIFTKTNAQYSNYNAPLIEPKQHSELSLHIGANTFLGDLGGNKGNGAPFVKDFNSKTVKPAIGLSYAYYPANFYKVMATVLFTNVNGADSLVDNKENGRYLRNLSFNSNLIEFSVSGELELLTLFSKEHEPKRFNPFIGAGVGIFNFKPRTKLNGNWVDLRPLKTEGEGFSEYPKHDEYKLTQLYIPVSVGARYTISNRVSLSLSATFRKTFTDYIDDVSTSYIDPSLFSKYLSAEQATLANALYKRAKDPNYFGTGSARGSSKKDSYTTVLLSLHYLLGSKNN